MPLLRLEREVLGMTDAPLNTPDTTPVPDRDMIATYASAVFGYCEHLVPVRALAEKGAADAPPHTPFLPADNTLAEMLARQADWAASAGMALFVVPGTVGNPGDARAEHILQTQVVLVDLDHGDIAAKRAHLERHVGRPTLVVASGGVTVEGQRKLHIYWRLTEPAEGEDIARVCRLRQTIAAKVGGDPAFKSAHQPIRVAGSIHAKGGSRRLVKIVDHAEIDHDLGELTESILAMPPMEGLSDDTLDFNGAGRGGDSVPELFGRPVREGGVDGTTRFDALSRVIGYWIRRCREGHVTPGEAWDEIKAYNLARIDPPWPEDRLKREAERLWQRDLERNGAFDDDLPEGADGGGGDNDGPTPVRFSEDALAARFAERHADRWRYVAGWGQWLTWTGAVWRREDTLQAFDLARQVCREAAVRAPSARIRTKLSSAATVAAVERLARSDRRHASTTEIWDRDPWLLNTGDGVIDLRSGALTPHDPQLFMTKVAGAASKGACPTWEAFLDTVTGGDVELQAYLRRMAGYCLTGVTTEHALFFLYGTGANGKSVFANTLTAIMGDYATVAAMDMFMATHGDRHPTDMAGLRGARIVTSIETEQGSRWAESKLKALTGGDKITARFMRQDFFEFIPQFKLLIVGNHKPSIRNVDEAMRRRLHMVPFTVTIPPAKRDRRLSDRLLAERDGILAWALQGCLEWQETGLRPPEAVMAATEDYFEAEDALGRWMEECCDVGSPSYESGSTELFNSWKSWAEANGEYAGSMKRFSETLSARGFEKFKTSTVRGFRGIAVKDNKTDLFEGDYNDQ
jgi:P4 family phage/plasmid primase-like protien